jgi:hypothetical protein
MIGLIGSVPRPDHRLCASVSAGGRPEEEGSRGGDGGGGTGAEAGVPLTNSVSY